MRLSELVQAAAQHPIFKLVKEAIPKANRLGKAVWLEHGKPNGYPLWQLKPEVPRAQNEGKAKWWAKLDNYSSSEHPPAYLQSGVLELVGTEDGKVWDTKGGARNSHLWSQLKTSDQLAKRIVATLFKPHRDDDEPSDED